MRDQNAKLVSEEYIQKLEAVLFGMHHRATRAEEDAERLGRVIRQARHALERQNWRAVEAILADAAEGSLPFSGRG
jgi:hypothetical protein